MRKNMVLSLAWLLLLFTIISISASAKTYSTRAKYHRLHGDIESVDATAQTFTIKHGNDTSTFKTDSSTKFRGAGKVITLADLQVGDDVRVSFTENGADKIATRIDVVHGKQGGTGGGGGPCCDCKSGGCKPSCCHS